MSAPRHDPYTATERLWLYVCTGRERDGEPRDIRLIGRVEVWAPDAASALAQARTVLDRGEITVERLPLPAVEPPGWEHDDAARVAWGKARNAMYEARNKAFWARVAAGERSAA